MWHDSGTCASGQNNQICLDDNTAESLAKGINELVSRGVDIINVSMGISSDNKELSTSIENATSKQIFVVCAAGNNFGDLLYPARYEKTISCLARSNDKGKI